VSWRLIFIELTFFVLVSVISIEGQDRTLNPSSDIPVWFSC
jgi:hypothetical protein